MILWISIKEQKTELRLFVTFEHFKLKILHAHAHGRTYVTETLKWCVIMDPVPLA